MGEQERKALLYIISQLQALVDQDVKTYEFTFDHDIDTERMPSGADHMIAVPTGVETITLRMTYRNGKPATLRQDTEAG